MIIFHDGQLSKKDKNQVWAILHEISDIYGDFYITINNLRLYIKDNIDIFYQYLKLGDKIAWSEKEGIIFVTGFVDKSPRKYLKILAYDIDSAHRL
jgi:hypothetical protein